MEKKNTLYVLCCNDYPLIVCSTEHIATEMKKRKEEEYALDDREKGIVRYWHIRECACIHTLPPPLKFCSFSPSNYAKCLDAKIKTLDDFSWCAHQKHHLGYVLCTYKK